MTKWERHYRAVRRAYIQAGTAKRGGCSAKKFYRELKKLGHTAGYIDLCDCIQPRRK